MKAPTKREILQELAGEVLVYQSSYREGDGVIRNEGALRTIAALKAATKIVRSSKESRSHDR